MPITTDPICQACKQPLGGRPATFAPAPSDGGTWHLHCDIRDCVRALQAAQRKVVLMDAPDQRLRGQL